MKNSLDKETRKTLNDLARHQAIVKLEADILFDMKVCEIEGWDRMEHKNMIRELLNNLGEKP